MPLYEYQCAACDKRFEVIQKFSDPQVETCKVCGKGPVQRLMSSPAIQFKGSGWYITDYAKKSSADKGKTGGTDAKGGEGTTDTAAKSDSGAKSDAPATPAATSTTASKESKESK
jgi:putative FmdB family regulatory protein